MKTIGSINQIKPEAKAGSVAGDVSDPNPKEVLTFANLSGSV